MSNPLHSVVLAGGKGTRLRAFARSLTGEECPKQFCRFGEPRSLLQITLDRIAKLTSPRRVVIVVPLAHAAEARRQLRGRPCAVVTQARDRGTGPGLLLPMMHVLAADPDAIVLITPSDHGVRDEVAFASGIRAAQAAINDDDATIILCGVTPDGPRIDYGWIVPGRSRGRGLLDVVRFVEKPSPGEARRLFRRGALWSTMVIVARASALLDVYWQARPDWARAMEEAALAGPDRERTLDRAYETLPSCDFSRDILTHAAGLAVQAWPASMGWTDLGTPERLHDWLVQGGQPTLG